MREQPSALAAALLAVVFSAVALALAIIAIVVREPEAPKQQAKTWPEFIDSFSSAALPRGQGSVVNNSTKVEVPYMFSPDPARPGMSVGQAIPPAVGPAYVCEKTAGIKKWVCLKRP